MPRKTSSIRNNIWSGIFGCIIGMIIGVYWIAPEPEVVTVEKKEEGLARESEVEETVATADRAQTIVIGTGPLGSAYNSIGVGLCRFLNNGTKTHGIKCVLKKTGGSEDNIKGLLGGTEGAELTMGVVQSRWLNQAYHGQGRFEPLGRSEDLRAVFSVQPEPLTVVARANSGIKHFTDLKGKRFGIGAPGTKERDAMDVLMAELGWDASAFSEVAELDLESQRKALCLGKVDAMVVADGNPSGTIRDASTFCNVVLVEVTGPAVDRLVESNLYTIATTIPGGTYRGTPNDTKTFGAVAAIASALQVPPDLVYEATKAVFDNFEEFKKLHGAFGNLTKEKMVNEGIQMPMHGGADKYLREVGLR